MNNTGMTAQPSGAWSYRPGSWFGVFGAATTLLLPASEKGRVGELWSQIDDGAGFDEVLDALLRSGLGMLSGFVLVSSGDGPTRILIRGATVRATIVAAGDVVELDGSSATTWVERTLSEVTSLSVLVDSDIQGDIQGDDIDDLTILGGLVRVGRIDQPPYAAPVPVIEPQNPPISDPLTHALDVRDAPVEVAEEASPLDEGSDVTMGGPPAPPVPPVWPIDTPLPPPLPPTSPPPPPPYSGPTAPPLSAGPDHDGLTQAVVGRDELTPPPPGIPGQPMAPNVVRSVATLVVSNGETVQVDRPVLIGRAPEARRHSTTDLPRLVTVPSPLHEISSTHIEIRPGSGADHGTAVVTDMGSTNGTLLIQPGLAPEDLKPGISVQLIPGATINLGDGISIQVAAP